MIDCEHHENVYSNGDANWHLSGWAVGEMPSGALIQLNHNIYHSGNHYPVPRICLLPGDVNMAN